MSSIRYYQILGMMVRSHANTPGFRVEDQHVEEHMIALAAQVSHPSLPVRAVPPPYCRCCAAVKSPLARYRLATLGDWAPR
jgi:hypothetical protein